MYKTMNEYDFIRAFGDMDRKENFSYESLVALYEDIKDFEETTGESVELDVIAICCEYSEYENAQEAYNAYSGVTDLSPEESLVWLEERTSVICTTSSTIIIQNF